jgi:hypothetical protein
MNRALIIAAILLTCLSAYAGTPYFQQRVNYDIKADFDTESSKIAALEYITYINNSPDTLDVIYFHLYYNAFQPGSYLDKKDRANGYYQIAGTSPRNQGYVEIDLVTINGEETGEYKIDNTIMTVPLLSPMAPGDTTIIYFEYTAQVPARGSRTARRGRHFDIGQWYPKPVVYDRYGWHIHQYLDYEFYSDYGDFYLELTLPSEYIVAHMGELQNEEDVFGGKLPVPDGDSIIIDALEHLFFDSISTEKTANTKDSPETSAAHSPGGDSADIIDVVQVDDERTTWIIRAENIHDFAFCADPDFIIDICRYNNITIKTYYKEFTRKRWERKAADYTRKALRFFSEKYYPYPYEKYSAVASLVSGGMEYPQLTMITRRSGLRGDHTHSLESIIAHEVAHAWFYGILGFNETEQSFLDEGLTSFANIQYLEHYYGRYHNNFTYRKSWQRRLLPNGNERNDYQRRYIRRARLLDEDPMITPANLFADGGRYYNASYEKAASIYLMLQYTLGEEKYNRLMRLLFERWALKHPYLSDLQDLAEEVHGGYLDWFFRQWFTTTWSIDYSLDGFKKKKTFARGSSGYDVTVTIGKHGRCISPLDVVFYFADGSEEKIDIPLEVWEDGMSSFDTTIFLPKKPQKASVNPDGRLADVNRLNNSSGIMPLRLQLLIPRFISDHSYIEHYIDSYTIAHRPSLWYNSVDGAVIGYKFDGSYIGQANNVDLEVDIGIMSGNVGYNLRYENPMYKINPDIRYFVSSRELDGRGRQEAGIYHGSRGNRDSDYFRSSLTLKRHYLFNPDYVYGDGWSAGDVNTVELKLARGFRHLFFRHDLYARLVSSVPGGAYDCTRVDGGMTFTLYNIGGNNTRFHIKAGIVNGGAPDQERFYLSTAGPYDIWDSPLFRSRGTLPDEWKNEGRLFLAGGGGMAGYLGLGLTGTRMMTAKLARELPGPRPPFRIPVLSNQLDRVSAELYAVTGLVWERKNNPHIDDYLVEAGLTFEYVIPYLDRLIGENRVTLHLPLWLSDPSGDENEFEWRWSFSISE